jgi:hypothetical protein
LHIAENSILSVEHLAALHASAIKDEVIQARGYRTITDSQELRDLGFSPAQCRAPGLLLPLWTTDGSPGFAVYRPDNPRVYEQRSRQPNPDGTFPCKVIKYEIPKGQAVRLDCPPTCRHLLADPELPLWVTEGQKKADALASLELAAIALLGVWNFLGKNKQGSSMLLADWDTIPLHNRQVCIIFDSDVMRKRPVQQALERLSIHLQRKGARVDCVYLPFGVDGTKLGVDDWLAQGHTLSELESLVEAPRPVPRLAPEKVELLDQPPVTMRRPLCLLEGRVYAATWVYVRALQSEKLNKQGEIIRFDPPREVKEKRLIVTRDDGIYFEEDEAGMLEGTNIEVKLPEIPKADRLWSAAGVKAYLHGQRAHPEEVFVKIAAVIDYFIDFQYSLSDHKTMVEMVACYTLSTWFLDAFNIIGYLWANGERGCGKTILISVISQLSYLGYLLSASGSSAALRDLAEYGATLALDDAENLADPRKTDPDKRALMLAGNRKEMTVPLKELGNNKNWHNREVNVYCPRLFSAIGNPDPTLASRAIIIPLVRTHDRRRANADPMDQSLWPHDRRGLIDECWALALEKLPELPEIDGWVGENALLQGRALQPWRTILAMAKWLEGYGVVGLWGRMNQLSEHYQLVRQDLESFDMTSLVIRALARCMARDIRDISDMNLESTQRSTGRRTNIHTAAITIAAQQIIEEDELDFDPQRLTSRLIGRVMSRLRLSRTRQPGKGNRRWSVSPRELKYLIKAYSIPPDDVTNVTDVTGRDWGETAEEESGAES